MGNNNSCKKDSNINICQTEKNVQCKCPNGIPVNEFCSKDSPNKCRKCLVGYGIGKTSNQIIDKSLLSKIKKLHNSQPVDIKIDDTIYAANMNGSKKWGYYINNIDANNECSILNSERQTYNENNLDNLELTCDEILSKKFVNVSKISKKHINDLDGILKDYLDNGSSGFTSSDQEIYNILSRINGSVSNSQNALDKITMCSNSEKDNSKRTIKQLMKKLAHIESRNNNSKERNVAINKRLVKMNNNNKDWYDRVFRIIKHLLYFSLILLFIIFFIKGKINDMVFIGLIIVLITFTLIIISNDIYDYFKN